MTSPALAKLRALQGFSNHRHTFIAKVVIANKAGHCWTTEIVLPANNVFEAASNVEFFAQGLRFLGISLILEGVTRHAGANAYQSTLGCINIYTSPPQFIYPDSPVVARFFKFLGEAVTEHVETISSGSADPQL